MSKTDGQPQDRSKNFDPSFYATEILVFLFQVLTLFLVIFFITDMFGDEARFNEFIASKLGTSTLKEFGLTLFMLTFCFGLAALAKDLIPGKVVSHIAEEVISEIPRTIYLFGSSITATSLAVGLYIHYHPSPENGSEFRFHWLSAFFAITFFIYGCAAKVLVKLRQERVNKCRCLHECPTHHSSGPPNGGR